MQKLSAQKAGYHQVQMDFMDSIIDALMTQRLSHFTVAVDGEDGTKVAVTPETFNADVSETPTDFYMPVVVSYKGKVYKADIGDVADDQLLQTALPVDLVIPVPNAGDTNEVKVIVYAVLDEATRAITGLHFGLGTVADAGYSVLPELVATDGTDPVVPIGILTIQVADDENEFVGGTADLGDYASVVFEDVSGLYPRFGREQ